MLDKKAASAALCDLLRTLELSPRQAARVLRYRNLSRISDNVMRDMCYNKWRFATAPTYSAVYDLLAALAVNADHAELVADAEKQADLDGLR